MIDQFAKDFLAGRISKYLKSAVDPKQQVSESDPVKVFDNLLHLCFKFKYSNALVQVVVGSSFDTIVLDKSKNVLLNLYHPKYIILLIYFYLFFRCILGDDTYYLFAKAVTIASLWSQRMKKWPKKF